MLSSHIQVPSGTIWSSFFKGHASLHPATTQKKKKRMKLSSTNSVSKTHRFLRQCTENEETWFQGHIWCYFLSRYSSIWKIQVLWTVSWSTTAVKVLSKRLKRLQCSDLWLLMLDQCFDMNIAPWRVSASHIASKMFNLWQPSLLWGFRFSTSIALSIF